MTDLEIAYRILELRPGASLKQISEAREDLLALWDPERLSHYPRLRSKAFTKVREINDAYEVLLEEMRRGTLHSRASSGEPSGARKARSADGQSASLFDEMFSNPPGKKAMAVPTWPILLLVLLLVAVLAYWLGARGGSGSEQPEMMSPAEEIEPSPGSASPPPEPADEPDETSRFPGAQMPPASNSGQSAREESSAGGQPGRSEGRTGPIQSVGNSPTAEPRKGKGPSLVREEVGWTEEGAESVRAFHYLKEASFAARTLIEGGFGDLSFMGWEPAGVEGSEVRVRLKATQLDGSTVLFTWSVDRKADRVFAVNQAAIRLEEKLSR